MRTPETHHEAHQSTISAVPQTAENNLSSPLGKIHHPCPNYQRWQYRSLAIAGQSKSRFSAVSSCSLPSTERILLKDADSVKMLPQARYKREEA
ncbi:hypothetical protein J6590_014010 [Homalodisca vitripennis]|nr:hypothetical protein J6590_014010 [Homalodisca vitripennis]